MIRKQIDLKLERAIYDKSYLYFIVFFLLMIAAFWLSYFSKVLNQENYRMHLHGVALILWCLLLVSQASLIRSKRNALHKQIGKFSYLLVPIMVITTVELMTYRIRDHPSLRTMDFYFIALVLNALIGFLIFYSLAIFNRRNPGIHGRFMICTILPMVTAVTDRIIDNYFPRLISYCLTIEGHPIEAVIGFIMVDLFLVGLCIWDWRSHKRWNVFPFALLVLLIYHYSVFNFYKFQFLKSFCVWFMSVYP